VKQRRKSKKARLSVRCPVCGTGLEPGADCDRCLWKTHFSEKKTRELRRRWPELERQTNKRRRRKSGSGPDQRRKNHQDKRRKNRSRRVKIILKSSRGERIQRPSKCSRCGQPAAVVWKYAKSNIGTVYLCSRCKPWVLDASFGKIDALDHAYQGGRFGG